LPQNYLAIDFIIFYEKKGKQKVKNVFQVEKRSSNRRLRSIEKYNTFSKSEKDSSKDAG